MHTNTYRLTLWLSGIQHMTVCKAFIVHRGEFTFFSMTPLAH